MKAGRYFIFLVLYPLMLSSCAKKEILRSEMEIVLPSPEPAMAFPPVPAPTMLPKPIPAMTAPPEPVMATPSKPALEHLVRAAPEFPTSSGRQPQPGKRIEKNRSPIRDIEGDDYKVVLGAESPIKIPGPPGRLRVWIGNKNYNPDIPKTMAQASSTIPALGTTAKVTPIAPAFEIEPKDSICVQIDPTGSDTFFILKPKEKGTYEVGANVLLYKSSDCSGTPIPKATTTLNVTVDVDDEKIQENRKKRFGEVFWEKILKFWGELLALVSALILFLLRRHLKKWFGFGEDG